MEKIFAIYKKTNRNLRFYLKFINPLLFFLMLISFSVFSLYSNFTRIVFSNDKVDILKNDLQSIAFYFYNFDRNLSNVISSFDNVLQDYLSWDNVFYTKKHEINNIFDYVKKHKEYVKKLWFSNYTQLIDFFIDLQKYQDEVFELLWKDKEYNYLIILQNTNEKRPNWGFFWSFAFVSVYHWHIKTLEIVDSYYPDYIAYKTYIPVPAWAKNFLDTDKIWFIASNKFWFTDVDWKNIKDLFEKIFNKTFVMSKVKKTMEKKLYSKLLHKYVKGVIFIRSDLFEYIFPNFTKKIWEWQFLNANIDLIRWEVKWNKKEIYIKEVKKYFDENKIKISKNIIEHFDEILDRNYIQIYLSNVSTGLNNFLIDNNLQNVFSTGKIYAFDTTRSYNKINSFLSKNIQILDSGWNILIDTQNDIVDISKKLKKGWLYTMKIIYSLSIPPYYTDFIRSLEKKYWIKMTDRELGILWLEMNHLDVENEDLWWKSNSLIYFPLSTKILVSGWDNYFQKIFNSPFSRILFYKIKIKHNLETKIFNVKFKL